MRWINTFVLVLLLALNGCATRGTAIPQGGPTMAQVYEQAMQQSQGNSLESIRGKIQSGPVNYNDADQLSPYTRTADNEINNLFPLLPNPQIVMYVTPHLAGIDGEPVPGYATAFPFYEHVHYALPGEISVASLP